MSCENTQDLSEFGNRELETAADLLKAYSQTSPDFLGDNIKVEFNLNSGCVFLIDEEFNVGMMNGDDLEQWINCPECGTEGFLEEMIEEGHDCCHTFLMESGLAEENDILASKVRIGETSSNSTRMYDIVAGVADLLTEELRDEWNEFDTDFEDNSAEMDEVFTAICDHLDDIAPEFVTFGASEGDGASYGFWILEEEE